MKAAVLMGQNHLEIKEVQTPSTGPQDVLINVKACAICSSDVSLMHTPWPRQPPYGSFIPGHEYAGTVVALGETVDEFDIDDRIAVEIHKGCGRCRNCIMGNYTACLNYGNLAKGHRANGFTTNGGFAEYAVNHVNTICKLPDNISLDEATLITTAGTSLYGIDMAGGYVPGDTIAVLGPGAIGLMAVQCCKAVGAGNVILTGTRDDRLELGRKLGADHVINIKEASPVDQVKKLTDDLGADLVLITAGGQDSLQQALEMTRRGGNITILAHFDDPVTADVGLAVKNGINIYRFDIQSYPQSYSQRWFDIQ